MRKVAAAVLALAALAGMPSSAAACDAFVPTSEHVLDTASVIVVGRVTAIDPGTSPHWNTATIRVERSLRGTPGEFLVIEQPAYLCGDGLTQSSIGWRVLIATDVPFGGPALPQLLSPFWWETPDGEVGGWWEAPGPVASLDALADDIATALPDTATIETDTAPPTSIAWLAAVAGLLALFLFLARPLSRRRAD